MKDDRASPPEACGSRPNERGLTKTIQAGMKQNLWRALIEVAFIIFLFYANLLMGVYERSSLGHQKGLAWAILEIFTAANFGIALVAAVIGYVVFEFLRKRL